MQEVLEKKGGNDGYFLMVEGGRVDHSNHEGNVFRMVTDSMAYHEAVQYVVARTLSFRVSALLSSVFLLWATRKLLIVNLRTPRQIRA